MIQLKVYDTDGTQYWIDLYEDQPIKLTLSIEDITNAEARSVFSRAFRVPATGNNNKFFKHAFLIDGIDYDVTVKKEAEVLVDGAEFRQGHIRLQKIFINEAQDKIDYEIIFLGETRDFSSQIGDASMCELDLPGLIHDFNAANIETSWDAYPETAGDSTAGLVNGDVLYPLINHGNEYDESGVPKWNEIAVVGSKRFTQAGKPAAANQFKPMIRAKALWDKIFEDSGYTYDSQFLEPDGGAPNLFTQLYVSAFGDTANPIFDTSSSSDNNFSATGNVDQYTDEYLIAQTVISDPGSNYNSTLSRYDVGTDGSYTFYAECYYESFFEGYNPGDPVDWISGRLELYVNGSSVYQGSYGDRQLITLTHTLNLTSGDTVRIYIQPDNNPAIDYALVDNQVFQCIDSPGEVNPISNFDCEYKQIDFVKDILTTFRLVMAPDPFNAKNFIIEPFVNYIKSGQVLDWSDKLDRSKDFQIEPLFFTQSDQIRFQHSEDEDYLNAYHKNAYKNAYGYLNFNSGNELLKGSRNIKTEWAPTPMTQIEGAPNTSKFVLPQIHVHEAGDNGTLHLPIKAKTRFLFYNGMQPVGDTSYHWHLDGITGHLEEYPLVSYSSEWPLSADGTILNWRNDVGYWGNTVSGYPAQAGSSLYDSYWGAYINSLYSSQARRVTAYFILNNVDLQNFSFDDVIFVNGTYYRPEKIIDAPVGSRSRVRVDLIKLLSYQSAESGTPEIPINYLLENTTTGFQTVANLDPLFGIGDIVDLVGQPGNCWEIIGGTQNGATTTILGSCRE